jgi:imidazolonepropionase-like amidohydrolase
LFIAFIAWFSLLAPGAAAPAPPKDAEATLFVRCGTLVVDPSTRPIGPTSLIIANGKVSALGASLPVPAGARLLDLSSYTVVPGFVDAHIHLWTGYATQPSDALAALRAGKAMRYALTSGVVAVRVLGVAASQGFIDVALKQAIEERIILGPRIIPSGHAISILGGHGDWFTFPETVSLADVYTPLHGFINSRRMPSAPCI